MNNKSLHLQPAKALSNIHPNPSRSVFVAHASGNARISAHPVSSTHLLIHHSINHLLSHDYVSSPQDTKLNKTELLLFVDHAMFSEKTNKNVLQSREQTVVGQTRVLLFGGITFCLN